MITLLIKVDELKAEGLIGKELLTNLLDSMNNGEEIVVGDKPITKQNISRAIKIDFLRGLDRLPNEEKGYVDIHISKVECTYSTKIHILRVYKSGKVCNVIYTDNRVSKYLKESECCICGSTVNHICRSIAGSSHSYGDKTSMQVMEHIIVAIAYGLFDGLDIEDIYKYVVNHKDNNLYNNSISNLELCTSRENNIHGYIMNSHPEFDSLTAKQAIEVYKIKINRR